MAQCRAGYRPRTAARRRRVAVLMCGCVRGAGPQGGGQRLAWLSARHVENQRKRSERRAKGGRDCKREREREGEQQRESESEEEAQRGRLPHNMFPM